MKRLVLLLMLVCSACQTSTPISISQVPEDTLPPAAPTSLPLRNPKQKATRAPTRTMVSPTTEVPPSSTPTLVPPTLTFTPLPVFASNYEPYTIEFLRSRTYGGGAIEVTEIVEENEMFTRYFIRYPSDGLSIHGFASVPKGEGPFPVIVAIHGFVDPAVYTPLDYTTSPLDGITGRGYIVIHPDLRNYPPSDNGDNLFRVGMAVDVLNLIALIKAGAGPAELFATAAPDQIGLWGHSMGGGIALRVLTISPDIKAATLFASLSGDERKNTEVLSGVFVDPVFQIELSTPAEVLEQISPMYYYNYITTPVQIQHGTADPVVPVAWAEETCNAMTNAGVPTECIYYPGEGHTFRSRVAEQVTSTLFMFYEMHLSP